MAAKSFYGRVVLVTGASSGIGLAIARLLLEQGYTVLGASRRLPERLPRLSETDPLLAGLVPYRLDITEPESCCSLVEQIMSDYGRLDALFHCAGSGLASAVEETPVEEVRWQMDQIFIGAVNVVRPVLPLMRNQKKGLIVMISSVAAFVPVPYQTYYSAAKAALQAYATGLADEVAPFGIRISVVSPGDTKTGYTDARRVISSGQPDSPYSGPLERSVARMARDEQNGMRPQAIARAAVKNLYTSSPPLNRTPGLLYKVALLVQRLIPTRLFRAIIRRIYAA
ncbi:MAG: SDR family NAD(P)-dependent oxidoreductase [Ruminococcaceae bacterium]|nr:SDR family NAD(P)-dependent oxidoreductase [Oscillospiraceae bacterium]